MTESLPVSGPSEQIGKGIRVAPGKYHTCILKFHEYTPEFSNHVCEFEILSTEPENRDEFGKVHRAIFYTSAPSGSKRKNDWSDTLLNLLRAAGCITNEEIDAAYKDGRHLDVDFQALVGKHVFIEIREIKSKKTSDMVSVLSDYGRAIYSVHDKKCVNFPRNKPVMVRDGIDVQDDKTKTTESSGGFEKFV